MRRRHEDTLKDFQDKKDHADRMWDRVYQDVLTGKIDLNYIVSAMDLCNRAEKALIGYEARHRNTTASRL